MKVEIKHIAKIEGHGSFLGEVMKGDVRKAQFIVSEGARLLEGILRGRDYLEVSQISARICGVCPVVHTLTSLKAIENALNVKISKDDENLRKLLMLAQWINSHSLHLFFFCLGDFFGTSDDLKLIKKYPKLTQKALAIREFGNQIIEIVGGRSIHPLTPTIGGFLRYPKESQLEDLYKKANKILLDSVELALIFAKIKYPLLKKQTNFVSLINSGEYAVYNGDIKWFGAKGSKEIVFSEFMKQIQEFQVDYNQQTKRSHFADFPFMVGALARFNNNRTKLNPKAKQLLSKTKIQFPQHNPFYNVLAQAIEIVHCVEQSKKLLKNILKKKLIDNFKKSDYKIKAGLGYGAIEAPRGTLFYFYELDKGGVVKNCNIIAPTAQNLANLEDDLKVWLPDLERLSDKERERKIKMLVRAYDPCLTCATH